MKLLLIILSILVTLAAQAQNWTRTAGPVEDDVFDICIDSNGWLFAMTRLGINRSTNGGDHWTRPFQFSIPSSRQGKMILAQNGNVVFSGDSGIYVSTDYGETFRQTYKEEFSANVNGFALTSSGRIFAARTWTIASDDHGLTWYAVDSVFGSVPLLVRRITASHDTIIAESIVGYDIFWSTNNGEDWSVWGPQLQTPPISYHITQDGSWVAVTIRDVLRQANHADTTVDSWKSIITSEFESDSIFVNFSPTDDGSMFLTSANNLWMGKQFAGWRKVASCFDFEAIVNRVVYDKLNKVYYLATAGSGVWKTNLPLATDEPINDPLELHFFPNPLTTFGTIRCSFPHPIAIEIDVVDNLGRTHMHVIEHVDEGISEIPIALNRLSAGSYHIRFRAGEFRESRWIVVTE